VFEGYPLVTSDVGWGCMLRVGQMMLAQTLRIQKGPNFYASENSLKELLFDFINENGKFSIETLAKIGYAEVSKVPGTWYSPFDIAVVIKKALQNKEEEAKAKGSPSFQLETIVTTSEFSLKGVYELTKVRVKGRPKLFKTKPCLLIIVCRIGFEKFEEKMLNEVIKILRKEKNCVGILGGKVNKAHYIFGTSQHSFIYLDPHCVKNQMNIESFLCETLFSMPHERVDTSMGLCFYLSSFKEMILTHERLRKMDCNNLIYCYEFEQFD
jgi:cysteine protease ATG4